MTLYPELTALEFRDSNMKLTKLWHYCDPMQRRFKITGEGNRWGKRHVIDSVCSTASQNLSGKWEA